VGSTYKSVGGKDDLIAGLNIKQQDCHFQSIGTTGGEKVLFESPTLLKIDLTEFGVYAIATVVLSGYCFVNIMDFFVGYVGLVEWAQINLLCFCLKLSVANNLV
jgi:hypothetical protein